MAEKTAESSHDRQSEAEALAPVARRILELNELIEDALALVFRNARARVPHFQRGTPFSIAAGHQHAAAGGVPNGVRDQVAQDSLDKKRVAVQESPAGAKAQRQSFHRGFRLEFQAQLLEK